MQHHPGTWYLPWGVPLQKMVAVPIHPAGPLHHLQPPAVHVQPMLTGLPAPLATLRSFVPQPSVRQQSQRKVHMFISLHFFTICFILSIISTKIQPKCCDFILYKEIVLLSEKITFSILRYFLEFWGISDYYVKKLFPKLSIFSS